MQRSGDSTTTPDPSRRPLRDADNQRWSAWMAAAQAGDDVAYSRLLEEISRPLEALVRRLLHDRELVEDCVQECLMGVHRARHTYDPARPFWPWLTAIARHKAIDTLRRRACRPSGEALDFVRDPALQTPAGACAAEARIDMRRVLSSLEPTYRDALVLTFLDDLSQAEAARKAGISRGAMKSRAHRALRKLRARLGTNWSHPTLAVR